MDAQLLAAWNNWLNGHLDTRLPGGWPGLHGEMATIFNRMIAVGEQRTDYFNRVFVSVTDGDFSLRVPTKLEGRNLAPPFVKNANEANFMMEQLSSLTEKIKQVAKEVGPMEYSAT
ncbi:MAG: hypothetical protein WDO06_09925 [Actinomycetota bacterium]